MEFAINTVLYSAKDSGTVVFRDEKTIGYQFINSGNCPVWLNNYLLYPGDCWKTLEPGMIDKTSYRMNFVQFDSCATTNAELTALIYVKQ